MINAQSARNEHLAQEKAILKPQMRRESTGAILNSETANVPIPGLIPGAAIAPPIRRHEPTRRPHCMRPCPSTVPVSHFGGLYLHVE